MTTDYQTQAPQSPAQNCAIAGARRITQGLFALVLLALPGFAAAACSGAAGDIGKAGETYTLGDGTVVSCDGLLIVNEAMIRAVTKFQGDGTYVFNSGSAYGIPSVTIPAGGPFDFGDIYTGLVTSMDSMLRADPGFDEDITRWDTSNVTNMSFMFANSTGFNRPIGKWDTSQVTTTEAMFSSASAFNQDIGGWDTSQVENMSTMFSQASAFNKDIGRWNTSKLTDAHNMFNLASAFNADISGWDVSKVAHMGSMFSDATSFNADISGWNTASLQIMSHMFWGASVFNADIGHWNTGGVGNMERVFADAAAFSQDLSGWAVCQVTNKFNFAVGAAFEANTALHPNFPPASPCAGTGVSRVIAVHDAAGTGVASGGNVTLSPAPTTGKPNTLVLTVKNNGADPLALGNIYFSNLMNVTIQSAVPGTTSVPGGGSTPLTVTFTPTADGALSFDLAITNNDLNSGSYLLSVAGTAEPVQIDRKHAQVLVSGAQVINAQMAMGIQSNASNRFAQAKGGNGRVFQNNLSQFQDQARAERAPGDAVALSTDQASATTDPSEALELIGQRLGLVDSNGWVSVTTDDLMMAATELSGFQSAAQVAQLDPGLAASLGAWDKAGSPFDGLLPGDGLDLYAAYSGGAYYKKGKEAYVGSSRDIMVGLDGFVTSDLFMGLALGRETSEIKFEGTLAGKLAQQGWRADAYAAWQAFEAFNLEGLVSYAGFANRLSAYGETGTPDSQRWIASGKASLELDWDRYSVSPYGSINYSHETFDAYTTNLGTAVAKVGVEQGQWSTGLRVQGHQPIIYGLTGYASASANGTWLNRDTVAGTLPLDVLDENQLTAAWQLGLTGSLAGFAAGSWLGDVLESADASLTYGQSGIFGANRASSWSVGLAWQY